MTSYECLHEEVLLPPPPPPPPLDLCLPVASIACELALAGDIRYSSEV